MVELLGQDQEFSNIFDPGEAVVDAFDFAGDEVADGVILGEGLRYAHNAGYVRGSIESAGLTLCWLENLSTRNEDNAPVPGLVAVAVK